AVYWPPADGPHSSARAQSAASISRAARPNVMHVSRSTGPGSPSSPSPWPVSALTDDHPAVAGDPEPSMTLLPTPGQPRTEPAAPAAKPAGAKKSRHKTTRRRRRDQGAPWAYAGSWRGQQFRYAGYGDRGAWLGYR